MTRIVKKIHMYMGLLVWSALLVYAIAGLQATGLVRPADRPRPAPETSYLDFTTPPNAPDSEVVKAAWEAMGITMAGPPGNPRRDNQQNLTFTAYSVNGPSRATVLENEKRIRVERMRSPIWGFFDSLHGMTPRNRAPDIRITLWKYYNEFALWCLSLMVLSGSWLWLASRPGYLWAQVSLGIGGGGFAILYWLAR